MGVTLSVNPRRLRSLRSVSRRGVVLLDSIRATDDCGILHKLARSRWLKPSAARCLIMAEMIAASASASSSISFPTGSVCFTWSLYSFQFIVVAPFFLCSLLLRLLLGQFLLEVFFASFLDNDEAVHKYHYSSKRRKSDYFRDVIPKFHLQYV